MTSKRFWLGAELFSIIIIRSEAAKDCGRIGLRRSQLSSQEMGSPHLKQYWSYDRTSNFTNYLFISQWLHWTGRSYVHEIVANLFILQLIYIIFKMILPLLFFITGPGLYCSKVCIRSWGMQNPENELLTLIIQCTNIKMKYVVALKHFVH